MAKLYCAEVKPPLYEEENEREIKESVFLVNGYHIADRLLEDVMFHVHFKDDEILSVKVDEDSAGYFSQFNEKMFYEQVQKYALRSIGGDEVEIPEELQLRYNWTSDTVAYIK